MHSACWLCTMCLANPSASLFFFCRSGLPKYLHNEIHLRFKVRSIMLWPFIWR